MGPSDNSIVRMPVTPLYSSLEKRREMEAAEREEKNKTEQEKERDCVCMSTKGQTRAENKWQQSE